MRDKQVFDTVHFPNMVSVHHYPSDDAFVLFAVMVPVGSLHSGGEVPFGAAHVLEHVLLYRSERHPEQHAFTRWVSARGGDINACTRHAATRFILQIPAQYAEEAWQGLSALVFHPAIKSEDVENSKGVIRTEAAQQRWYPGTTALGAYLWGAWMHTGSPSVRQIYGDEKDIAGMTADALTRVHAHYPTHSVHIMVAGLQQIPYVYKDAERLETIAPTLTEQYVPMRWGTREYHMHASDESASPTYYRGSFYPLPSGEERAAVNFLLEFLTNPYHSPLYAWLRHERGWVYDITYQRRSNTQEEAVLVEIPLLDQAHVENIRVEFSERVARALNDEPVLRAEVERQLGEGVFSYQTLWSIVDDGLDDLERYGCVTSYAAYQDAKRRCADPTYAKQVFDTFFSTDTSGELLAVPSKKEALS